MSFASPRLLPSAIMLAPTITDFMKHACVLFPEASLFLGKASEATLESAEGTGSEFPGMPVEAQRAWGSLVTLKRIYSGAEEDYHALISGQAPLFQPLTKATYGELNTSLQEFIGSNEDRLQSLMWHVLCNDLGKLKWVSEQHTTLTGRTGRIGHEERMLQLLQLPKSETEAVSFSETTLPGYHKLTTEEQAVICNVLSLNSNLSNLQQGEEPPTSFEKLREYKTADEFTHHFWETLCDVGGAAAQSAPGAQRLHEQTARHFINLKAQIEDMHTTGKSGLDTYWKYMEKRGEYLGFGMTNPMSHAIQRLISLTRLGGISPEVDMIDRDIFRAAWGSLEAAQQELITSYFSANGDVSPSVYLAWGSAVAMNPQTEARNALKTISIEDEKLPEAKKIAKELALRTSFMTFYRVFSLIPESIRSATGQCKLVLYFVNELKKLEQPLIAMGPYSLKATQRLEGPLAFEVRLDHEKPLDPTQSFFGGLTFCEALSKRMEAKPAEADSSLPAGK